MWTVNITDKEIINSHVRVYVTFTNSENSADKVEKFFDVTDPGELDKFYQITIKELETSRAGFDSVAIGPYTIKGTVDGTDKLTFFKHWNTLQELYKARDNGLTTANSKEITDLETQVKQEYKPEYFIGS